MGKQNGLGNRLLVAGNDLSGDISALDSVTGGPSLLDFTDITQSAHERKGGLRDGSMGITSFFDATLAHPVLSALPVADQIVSYLLGTAIGSAAACCNSKLVGYNPTRGADGSLLLKTEAQASGFGLEWGQLLTAGIRTDTAATHGTALDGGASSSFGGQAYLQLTAFTGTDVTLTVEHSADNSTFATLVAFAQVTTAHQAQRVAVTSTVNRYVRVSSSTSGGFTSASFAVVFTRNPVAVSF